MKWRLNMPLRLLFIISILAAAAQVMTLFASHVSPNQFWPFAFFGLAFPIIFVLNMSLALIWLGMRRWHFMMPLVMLFCSWSPLQRTFQMRGSDLSDAGWRIMSYNVLNLGLYEASQADDLRTAFFDQISEAATDILCLQEFYSDHGQFDNLSHLKRHVHPNVHFEPGLTLQGHRQWGLLTASRFPIVDRDVIVFGNARDNFAIWTDLQIDGDTIRVFNTHLQSVHLNREDYRRIDDVAARKSLLSDVRVLLRKLRSGYFKRAYQVDILKKEMDQSPHPIILCGDFNDTPVSYTYRTLGQGLNDAFVQAGQGFGSTWAGSIPGLRIDYIFLDSSLKTNGYGRLAASSSDHHAILATFLKER